MSHISLEYPHPTNGHHNFCLHQPLLGPQASTPSPSNLFPSPKEKILKMQNRPCHSPAHNPSVMSPWSRNEKQALTFTRKAPPWLAPTGSSTFAPHQVPAPAAGRPALPEPRHLWETFSGLQVKIKSIKLNTLLDRPMPSPSGLTSV